MTETMIAWIAGIFLSLVGWGSMVHFAWIVRNWSQARGVVVGNNAEWSKAQTTGGPTRHTVYFPKIEFDAGGKLHRAKGGSGRSKPYKLGEAVNLYHKPANPDHILDLNFRDRMLFSGGFAFIGSLCLAAANGWIS